MSDRTPPAEGPVGPELGSNALGGPGPTTDALPAGTARSEMDSYWRRRERTARALAARAVDAHIARIHLDMARRYAALADDAAASCAKT